MQASVFRVEQVSEVVRHLQIKEVLSIASRGPCNQDYVIEKDVTKGAGLAMMFLTCSVGGALIPAAICRTMKGLAYSQINGWKRLAIHLHQRGRRSIDRPYAECSHIFRLDHHSAAGLIRIDRSALPVELELIGSQPVTPVMAKLIRSQGYMLGMTLLGLLDHPVHNFFEDLLRRGVTSLLDFGVPHIEALRLEQSD